MSTAVASSTSLGNAASATPGWKPFWLHVMTAANHSVSHLVKDKRDWENIKKTGNIYREPPAAEFWEDGPEDGISVRVDLRKLEVARAPRVVGDTPAFLTREAGMMYTPDIFELSRQSLPAFFKENGMEF